MLRGLAVWLIIMLAETLHGIVRGLWLVPRFGEATAGRIGLLAGTALVLAISLLLIRWTGLRRPRDLLLLGVLWAGLTALFEILVGLLRGFGLKQILGAVDPTAGGPMLYVLAVMYLAPWLAAKLRRIDAGR